MTAFHASHFIKDMRGISLQQYLNQVRFEHAITLLETTKLSVTDVCITVGFSSTRYLNHMFQSNFKSTCKEYIRSDKKRYFSDVVLPTGNIQNRLSFQQSKLLFQKYFSTHDRLY